jgi:hypothetical protein
MPNNKKRNLNARRNTLEVKGEVKFFDFTETGFSEDAGSRGLFSSREILEEHVILNEDPFWIFAYERDSATDLNVLVLRALIEGLMHEESGKLHFALSKWKEGATSTMELYPVLREQKEVLDAYHLLFGVTPGCKTSNFADRFLWNVSPLEEPDMAEVLKEWTVRGGSNKKMEFAHMFSKLKLNRVSIDYRSKERQEKGMHAPLALAWYRRLFLLPQRRVQDFKRRSRHPGRSQAHFAWRRDHHSLSGPVLPNA